METGQNDHDVLLGQKLDSFDLSTRTANCLRNEYVETIGQLVTLRSNDVLKWQNAGKKTLVEIRLLLASVGLKLSDDLVLPGVIAERSLPIVSEPAVLEEELYRFVSAVGTERNSQILVKLWGWDCEAPRTLDSVGKEFALTRERVRQIEKRALERLRKHHFDAPLLRKAISTLRNAVPDVESTLGAKLREYGVCRSEFRSEGIKVAAENLGIKWPFEYVSFDDKQILFLIGGEAERYHKAISLLRKKTSERGCVNVLSLASDVQLEESKLPALRRILDVVSKVEWLDDSREWLYSLESPRNRLRNICSKVLGVAPRVHLSELRRAVSKSRRLAMCPPQRILGAFIERCGLGRVEESIVVANSRSGKAPGKDSAEGLMLRVLDEHGPVMDGEVFAEKCIAAGMNATTFYIYRINSPVICALGKNVYCKVGTDVPPGTVEDIVGQRRAVVRVSDHGWTSTGRLWCGIELTRQVITAGGIRLPSFVADFVQGEWQVALPDGSEYGTVMCRNLFIWSFRKPFAVLGAEPTDMAAFEFNLKSRQVLVKVGGPDLFEAIQDPGSAILEEVLEET
jgi:hypothetical protein